MVSMNNGGGMKTLAFALSLAMAAGCIPCSWADDVDPWFRNVFDRRRGDQGEIEFYGKVIDQDGAPIEQAAIHISMPTQETVEGPEDRRARILSTDSNGCFEVSRGALGTTELKGIYLNFDRIIKNGYEECGFPPDLSTFSFSQSNAKRFVADPSNPVVYRMRKKGECAFLLEEPYWQLRLPLAPSNQTRGYDFIQREAIQEVDAPAGDDADLICDLRVRVAPHANGAAWQVVLSPGNATGGILVSDQLLHEAPEQGYQPEGILSWPGLGQAATKYVYLKSRDPAIYTRLAIGYINANGDSFLLDGKTLTNPYGDRNLEPMEGLPYAVTKQLTDEARTAFQQNKRPAKPDLERLISEATGGAAQGHR